MEQNVFCVGPTRSGIPKRTDQIRCWLTDFATFPLNLLLSLCVPCINVLTGNPVKVLKEFCYRLTKLYSASAHSGSQNTDNFPDRLSLPTLTEAPVTLMDRDIQVSEVLQSIKDLKMGKRSGPNGYSALIGNWLVL